ncbi:MAG TPA: helix-turn-helix domain-containing protein [Actinomycetota bacterium]|jgi:predicted ArsR family transcriptional regulator
MVDPEKTAAVAALDDPLRRRLYEHVRRARHPVTREEAADSAGISRNLAAFHLDKLAERGLLSFTYARPESRSGPGAGRPAKTYVPSAVELDVSIPERKYDVIGKLLVEAIKAEDRNPDRSEVAASVAAEEGRGVGERIRSELHLRAPGTERALSTATEVLEAHGYEPYRAEAGSVRLQNCPFHALSRHAPELVCRMNRAFIEGVVRGIGNESVEAALEPTPGECCVVLRPSKQYLLAQNAPKTYRS